MPVDFDNQVSNQELDTEIFSQDQDSVIQDPIVEEPNQTKKVQGLSEAEMNDPNSIIVTVSDPDAPLVILFGPPACGKTMTLVRLTRYLKDKGFILAPIRTFRPVQDTNYSNLCENFDTMISSNNAAASTDRISFMLVEVIKDGRRLCQILEAPGEYYFNPKEPNAPFPAYVNSIAANSNRKIWTFMVEPNWLNLEDRRNYVSKIGKLKQQMRPKDSTIFVYNKIDTTNFVRSAGDVNMSQVVKDLKNNYPSILDSFKNQNPITKLWRDYNCDVVPFQTGYYTNSRSGLTYQEGPEEYCRILWNSIMNCIKG